MVLTYLKLSFELCQSFADCACTVQPSLSGLAVFEAPRATVTAILVHTTTTHQAQQNVTLTCFYHGFLCSWQFFQEGCRASCCGSKHSSNQTVCLNHTVVHKYMINAEFYLTLSKYVDKLLVGKSLVLRQTSSHVNQQSTKLIFIQISGNFNQR